MARRYSHVEFPFKFFDEMGKKLSESYYPDLWNDLREMMIFYLWWIFDYIIVILNYSKTDSFGILLEFSKIPPPSDPLTKIDKILTGEAYELFVNLHIISTTYYVIIKESTTCLFYSFYLACFYRIYFQRKCDILESKNVLW